MRIQELLAEVGSNKQQFRGQPCKANCRGHGAGYLWAGKKRIRNPQQCTSTSSSFRQGCQIRAQQAAAELREAAYSGNIGAMEVAKFYQIATPQQKDLLKELIAAKKTREAWQLIQKITGVKLVGSEFKEQRPYTAMEMAIMQGGHSLLD